MRLYFRLAKEGIFKNKRLYFPFFLTCVCMVTMFTILNYLSVNPLLDQMGGGGNLKSILGLGRFVLAGFSLIFLFYTNSFLMRRRKKEFGLYNILGMGKKNLARVILYENLMVCVSSLLTGLASGLALSKLAELGLLKVLKEKASYSYFFSWEPLWNAAVIFGAIFFLLLLNALWQVYRSKPIELLHSESFGEKAPKANWVLALLGIVLLGVAYYLSVSLESPLKAIIWFFVAVIMVIVATYLLMISGSVALCRLLQKKKSFYYNPKRFVSISSMVYRMKRNGAGLASICILCTMVLVMISSSMSLYVGEEDSLQERYPYDLSVNINALYDPFTAQKAEEYNSAFEEGLQPYDVERSLNYRKLSAFGILSGNTINAEGRYISETMMLADYSNIRGACVIPLEDYNRIMGTDETLADGEALLYATKEPYEQQTISLAGLQSLTIKRVLTDFFPDSKSAMEFVPIYYLVVPNFETLVAPLMENREKDVISPLVVSWCFAADIAGDADTEKSAYNALERTLHDMAWEEDSAGRNIAEYSTYSRENERDDFFSTYGGLFFIGIILSLAFVLATVLILYYKQISEGYEDRQRFDIMRRVGMSTREIRKSVNSQILTVFFLPLIPAGMHLAFAFPLVWKILQLFGLTNLKLLIFVTIGCYLVFALLYTLVYRLTSNAYYTIVSGGKSRE